jgi:hypothetical protein
MKIYNDLIIKEFIFVFNIKQRKSKNDHSSKIVEKKLSVKIIP